MIKKLKTLVFCIGVDILGFPQFHKHEIETQVYSDSQFFRSFSKK